MWWITASSRAIELESPLRLGFFAVSISIVVLAERLRPFRPPESARRLVVNASLMVTNALVTRLLASVSLVVIAQASEASHLGLFWHLALPTGLEFVLALLVLDAGMYVQHRLFHWVPWLWRMHAVHHSDTAFDVTTGVRFHPAEIVVSLGLKALTVVTLGASPAAVLTFEVLLNAATLFTHSNLSLDRPVERLLRRVIVTPDVHRLHHSVDHGEHNRNFGFFLLWWDVLGRTYQAESLREPRSMPIGLSRFRTVGEQTFIALLRQPFLRGSPDAGP